MTKPSDWQDEVMIGIAFAAGLACLAMGAEEAALLVLGAAVGAMRPRSK